MNPYSCGPHTLQAASAVPRSLVICPATKIRQEPTQQSSEKRGEPGGRT